MINWISLVPLSAFARRIAWRKEQFLLSALLSLFGHAAGSSMRSPSSALSTKYVLSAARAAGGGCAAANDAHSSARTSDHVNDRWLRNMRALLSYDRADDNW